MQQYIRVRACITSDRTGSCGSFPTDGKFIRQKAIHSRFIHNQHEDVSRCATDLQAVATTFDPNGGRRSKSPRVPAPTRYKSSAILATEYERCLLDAGNDYDALGFVK